MKTSLTRREFASLLGLGAAWPFAARPCANDDQMNFRIRTITAGIPLHSASNLAPAQAAVAFLQRARGVFEAEGYEVQTLRLATQPLRKYLHAWDSLSSLQAIKAL